MKDFINIGIVGAYSRPGWVASVMRTRTAGRARIVACVEPSDVNYEKSQQTYKFKDMTRYASVADMVANEQLDGIIIGSPNMYHLENLLALKGKSIPVLLEKPLDASWENI